MIASMKRSLSKRGLNILQTRITARQSRFHCSIASLLASGRASNNSVASATKCFFVIAYTPGQSGTISPVMRAIMYVLAAATCARALARLHSLIGPRG